MGPAVAQYPRRAERISKKPPLIDQEAHAPNKGWQSVTNGKSLIEVV